MSKVPEIHNAVRGRQGAFRARSISVGAIAGRRVVDKTGGYITEEWRGLAWPLDRILYPGALLLSASTLYKNLGAEWTTDPDVVDCAAGLIDGGDRALLLWFEICREWVYGGSCLGFSGWRE